MSQVVGLEMDFREHISRLFEGARINQRISQKEAAKQIGISPQRFNLYLAKQATPSAFVFLKACKRWNLKVVHEGVEFSARKLSKKQQSRLQSPEQLPLFSVLKELGDDSLDVRINKKGPDRLDLSLEIKFAG
jgi:transcriptional regulator with XRE-family HTH domain